MQLNLWESVHDDMQQMIKICKFPGNSTYIDRMYRMYARQQMAQLNLDMLPFLQDVIPATIIDKNITGEIFWRAYSESGMIVAKISRIITKISDGLFNMTLIPELKLQVEDRLTKLKELTEGMPYIQTLVTIDEQQILGMLAIQMGDSVGGLAMLAAASELELNNVKDSDSPTLPIVPALETYASYLAKIDPMKSKELIESSKAHWSHRHPVKFDDAHK